MLLTQGSTKLTMNFINQVKNYQQKVSFKHKTVTQREPNVYYVSLLQRFPAVYVIFFENKDFDMSTYLYFCMSVRGLFPHSAKTNGPIFKIQTA